MRASLAVEGVTSVAHTSCWIALEAIPLPEHHPWLLRSALFYFAANIACS